MGVRVGGEEGYQVNLGGGADTDQGIGRELFPAMLYSEVGPRLHGILAAFTAQSLPGESFLSFTRRHPIEELRVMSEAGSQAVAS